MAGMKRRDFISGAALAAAISAVPSAGNGAPAPKTRRPYEGIGDAPFKVGEPCLQAAAETTMGVTWAVSGLAKGVVEVADNPEMKGARTVKSGGYGLVPIDVDALEVRLEGLKPGTRYWYRTITTPFTDYRNIYDAKLGTPVVGKMHSFTTLGTSAAPHFCVINDTHAQWRPFGLAVKKVKELAPTVLLWNGDATNTTQSKETAVQIFLRPPVEDADYAADVPTCFVSGNHDFRGSWISKKEEVVQPRHPAERTGAEWDLKWNFAVRLGDMALIGMDTGEDKPDAHPKWFGLANFEPYRKAQSAWLEKALSRPEIAAAPFKVFFCHIPLFSEPGSPEYSHDGVKIDPHDFAYWSRECHDLWNPILVRHGVTLVVAAHQHKYRYDAPTAERPWAQIVGGGPEMPKDVAARFPTVIEGKMEGGELKVVVHNVKEDRVQAVHSFKRK